MWSSIVLVLLLGETADAPQQPCDWWWREADASGAVPRVTPGSGVLLPLSMSPFRPSPYEDDPRLDPADLRVVVRDATWPFLVNHKRKVKRNYNLSIKARVRPSQSRKQSQS